MRVAVSARGHIVLVFVGTVIAYGPAVAEEGVGPLQGLLLEQGVELDRVRGGPGVQADEVADGRLAVGCGLEGSIVKVFFRRKCEGCDPFINNSSWWFRLAKATLTEDIAAFHV